MWYILIILTDLKTQHQLYSNSNSILSTSSGLYLVFKMPMRNEWCRVLQQQQFFLRSCMCSCAGSLLVIYDCYCKQQFFMLYNHRIHKVFPIISEMFWFVEWIPQRLGGCTRLTLSKDIKSSGLTPPWSNYKLPHDKMSRYWEITHTTDFCLDCNIYDGMLL